MFFSAASIYSYGFAVPIIYFCYGGTFALFPTQTVRVFGEQVGIKLYCVVFIGASLGSVLQFLLHYLVVDNKKTAPANKADGYFILFIIFGVIQAIALLMSLFVKY